MKIFKFYLLLFMLMFAFVSEAFSDVGTNDTCADAEIIPGINNVNITKTVSIAGTLTNGTDKQDFYKFTVAANGTLEINSTSSIAIDFFVGNTCVSSTCGVEYYDGSADSVSHSSPVFNVSNGTTVYFKLDKNGGVNYTVDIAFTLGSNSPFAVNDAADTNGTEPVVIDVLNNDYDVDGSLVPATVSIVTAPTKGTITNINAATGEITYAPSSFDIVGDSFTYTVKDNTNNISNTATVTVTYPKPIAYNKIYALIPSGTLNGNIITDAPISYNIDDNLTMNANSAPTVGTLSPAAIASDGTFSYTATAAIGSATFTYSIINKYGMVSNTATATIYVNQYCANAITLLSTDTNCTTNDTNTTAGSVTSDGGQYYEIILAEDGILDINLTNTDPQVGGTILYYDFGTPCGSIFTKGTTSQLDAGFRSETASIILSAGTYYLGLQGKSNTNPTDYNIDVTFRSACSGGPPISQFLLSSIGINEPGIHYDSDKNITTKIVDKTFALHASYLDSFGNVDIYDGSFGSKTVDMTVIISIADGDTCSNDTVIGQGFIAHNTEDTVITPLQIANAAKNKRIKTVAFDYGQLFRDASGLNCAQSSLNSGLCLVPACFNNVQNIRSVFPPAFQPGVMTCIYGDGTGADAPCDSLAYYGNCGGTKGNISPQQYNNDLGCAMCLADAVSGDVCSADEFAIRPNNFSSTIAPNQIFDAGKQTPLTFYANKFGGVGTPSYDENENTSFVVDVNISDSNRTCTDMSINFNPIIDFTNGVVSDNYALNNVGDFNVTMHETVGSEFAFVDTDDSNDTQRLITPFSQQIRVIPHHFGIDANLTNGSNGFTYLLNFDVNASADQNLSALLNANITAQTEGNTSTTNYSSTCYAKNGTISLGVVLSPAPSAADLTKMLWYDDNNNTIVGNFPIAGPFSPIANPLTRFDNNGTANVRYRLNFDRNITKVVNPFLMTINEINATDTDAASGTGSVDNSATYQYGRTHASRQRYQGPTGSANIYFESYCFGTTCNKNLLPNGLNSSRTDDARWYVNPFHATPTDGIVGSIVEKGGVGKVTATAATAANPSTTNLTYDTTSGYPYKTTIQNSPSPWLIYNETDPTATRNEFQVEFDNQGTWTGENETDTTTKDVGAVKSNRRIMW